MAQLKETTIQGALNVEGDINITSGTLTIDGTTPEFGGGGSGSGVGQTTENNGEIFNAYEYNQAIGTHSHAEGGPIADDYTGAQEPETVTLTFLNQYNEEITRTISGTLAEGNSSHVEGSNNIAYGATSHAEGNETIAGAGRSHAEGSKAHALGVASHAEGRSTKTWAKFSHVEGQGNTIESTGEDAHAEGYYNTASGKHSHAEGNNGKAIGVSSHSEGNTTKAEGNFSHSEGVQTHAIGNGSHVEGYYTIANAPYQHVQGKYNVQDDAKIYAHIVGNGTGPSASERRNIHTLDWDGNAIFAGKVYSENNKELITTENVKTINGESILGEGDIVVKGVGKANASNNGEIFNHYTGNTAGNFGHAEGALTNAGDYAHAEGFQSQATGSMSHAEGQGTKASGNHAHAEGNGTIASEYDAHAEGLKSEATGAQSHAEGFTTKALKNYTHTEGYHTIANSTYQHVQGKYNNPDDTGSLVHIVGWGTGDDTLRRNIHTINTDGQGYFANGVTSEGGDYAEYFEWQDGNINDEDRIGLLVSLDGEKIKLANFTDDILGVISGTASVVGDNPDSDWNKKYLKDDFGRIQYEEIENFDSQGKSLGFIKSPILNPNYDSNKEYINRANRREWDIVGLIGKLYVRDDGTCTPNFYATVGVNGIATSSLEKTNMRVLSRVNDNVIRVLLK